MSDAVSKPVGFSVELMRAFADGRWVMGPVQIGHLVAEAANEIERLRDELTAANLERGALKQALVKVADPNIIRTSESFRQIALDALEPK